MKYVAFLRGINSGKNPSTKMADLKASFESFGFERVETVLASGNVIFSTEKNLADVIKVLNSELSQTLGFSTYAFVLTDETVKELLKSNPFGDSVSDRNTKCYVSFVGSESTDVLPIKKDGYEMKKGPHRMVFSSVDLSVSGSPDLMNVLDKNWKENTTRGWSTIERIGKKF